MAGISVSSFAQQADRDIAIFGVKSRRAFNFQVTSNPNYNTSEKGVTLWLSRNKQVRNIYLVSNETREAGSKGLSALRASFPVEIDDSGRESTLKPAVSVIDNVVLHTGPSETDAIANATLLDLPVLRFAGQGLQELLLLNNSRQEKDTLDFRISEAVIIEKGSQAELTLVLHEINSRVNVPLLWLKPGSTLILAENPYHFPLSIGRLKIGDESAAHSPATIRLSTENLSFSSTRPLVFNLDRAALEQENQPLLVVESERDARLVLQGRAVTLESDEAFEKAFSKKHTIVLMRGTYMADAYKIAQRIRHAGHVYEIKSREREGRQELILTRLQ